MKIIYCFLILFFLILACVAFINLHGDEEADACRDAFYLRSEIKVPNTSNLAVAICGLNAPDGVSIIAHERFVLDTYNKTHGNEIAKKSSAKKKNFFLLAM